ncbi:hypothetical protein N2488_09810 [SAR92 clade bacterium H231]|jgi:hypothetical protein|nr:hypothetical protein [SAR92 clade bacterium H231]MDG1447845.1 hypothetical protein [Porticoccaceae bacterium]MDG1706743.1 hypothetical protein [Porticoccaceae bacterium]
MTVAVLELNDQNLIIQTEDGTLHSEPGFAQLTATGIETGDSARAVAWQQPQHSYNQYWRQFNQLALPSKQRWARHHADIAFAQLKQLVQAAGSPESLILSVPGSFSDQQLSLLLGLASAVPVQIVAVIDSALASCADQQTQSLLIELQLQQAVVTRVAKTDGQLQIADQEVIPDLGVMQLYNAAARHISDQLITDYRYDPLHTSDGEQLIYNQLPQWLMQLGWEDEISVTLPSAQGELNLVLRKQQIAQLFEQRLNGLHTIIAKYPKAELCFSHSASLLPTLLSQFAEARLCNQNTGIDNCFNLQDKLAGKELHRISELEAPGKSKAGASKKVHQATHLLYQNHGYPLDHPVSIHIKDNQLSLVTGIDNRAALVFVVTNHQLKVQHQQDNLQVQLPKTCQAGSSLTVAGHKLRLIEVSNA